MLTAPVELELFSIWFNDDDVEGVWIGADDEGESVVEGGRVVGAVVVVVVVVVIETDSVVDGEAGVIEEGGDDDDTGNGEEWPALFLLLP